MADTTNTQSQKQNVSSKKARLNANAQKREAKRKATSLDVRFFSTSSGGGESNIMCKTDIPGCVPRIITIIPLLSTLSPRRFLANLLPILDLPSSELDPLLSSLSQTGTYLLRAPRFKTNLQINLLPPTNVWESLDAALISDYVVLLMSSVDEVQLEGEGVLRCLQGQVGGVEIIPCVQVGLTLNTVCYS
jgi:pre-rRNA-processing protein TSR1